MEDEVSLQVEIIKEKSQKELDDEIKKKKEKQARFLLPAALGVEKVIILFHRSSWTTLELRYQW